MPPKNPYQKWKSSLHYAVFKKIKDNPKISLHILLFDALFFAILYCFNLLSGTLLPQDITRINTSLNYIFPLVLVGYLLLLILMYSFFKYIVLNFIGNLIDSKNDYKRIFFGKQFFKFVGLNLIIFCFMFFIFAMLNLILTSFITQKYLDISAIIILLLFVVFVYLVLNIAHILFVSGVKLKEIPNKIVSGGIFKKCLFIILSSIIFLVVYFVIFYVIALMLTPTGIENNLLKIILILITNLAYYLIHFHNRVYLYLMLKNVLPQHKSSIT